MGLFQQPQYKLWRYFHLGDSTHTCARIPTPLRVNAYGNVLIFDKFFAVTNCDHKSAIALSSGVFAVAICDRKTFHSSLVSKIKGTVKSKGQVIDSSGESKTSPFDLFMQSFF